VAPKIVRMPADHKKAALQTRHEGARDKDLVIWVSGAPGAIRTPDPQIRSLVLYPAELRAHSVELQCCLRDR
jgi:hypothetical protein